MIIGIKQFRKDNLKKDIIAGIVVALVSIPIAMGYAQVAGLPPVYGLYGSIFPILVYCLLTSSPQFVFGVDATPAVLVGGALAGMGIVPESQEALRVVPVITIVKTDYWDIDAMADAIYAIVKYPAMYKSLRELGRDEVNNIKWYDVGLKVRRIYDMVISGC